MIVTIEKQGHDINVLVDGFLCRNFHEISDDYAYTNAREYADKLRLRIAKGTFTSSDLDELKKWAEINRLNKLNGDKNERT